MDRPRTGFSRRKRIRRTAVGAATVIGVGAVALAPPRLEPAAPSVDAAAIFADTVRRGEMLREVRGIGTLVPEAVVVLAATAEGRVERRHVQPGQAVRPGTLLLELGSPGFALFATGIQPAVTLRPQ